MASLMKLSVIIPTRNRAGSLKVLLDSIEAAVCPDGVSIEVIVVNNRSSDDTCEMLQQEASKRRTYRLTILQEDAPGKSRALNQGLQHAQGDLFLVLDDDVSVDQQCFVEHVRLYRCCAFAALQGRVLPGEDPYGKAVKLNNIREYNIPLTDHGNKVTEIRGLTGTNMSFRREVKDKVGLFDVRLGPGASGFSEDTEYSMRIRRAGFRIGYTPEAIVYHELNPARYGREYNREVEYRKGLSRSLYRHDSICLRVLPKLFVNCIRYVIHQVLRQRERTYRLEGRMMKSCGYLMGKLRKLPISWRG
jgi:glycosyltransferase involved in cell wall biosynthesis